MSILDRMRVHLILESSHLMTSQDIRQLFVAAKSLPWDLPEPNLLSCGVSLL